MRTPATLLALAAFGCGPTTAGDGETLTLDPAASELWIRNGVAATEAFTATLGSRDVTDEVSFSIDTGYGDFTGNLLTLRSGGKAQVTASIASTTAVAEVVGRVDDTRIDPSLPQDAADWFDHAADDPSRAPTVVYPSPDVVMPRNLGDFEAHWTDAKNDVFEVSLETDYTRVRVIAPGGNGSVAHGSWLALLPAEWDDAVGHEMSVQLVVRGVSRVNPTTMGTAPPRRIDLGNEAMLGGVYYWAATAASGPAGIFRHDMSKPGQPAEPFMTTQQTAGRCVACHVLSRDGTKMAITYDGGNGPATLVDVATQQAQTSRHNWNFGTFTPDGTKLLAVENGQLTVLRYANQAVVATMTSTGYASQPDLSPDGTQLVYTRQSGTGLDYAITNGQIVIRTFDSSTNAFGPERVLVTGSGNNYYPSFSPDGVWVLFTRAASGTSYDNAAATLWITKADGTGAPIQLARANGTAGLTDSWGRWAPFAQTLGASGEPLYWITFSSKRDFGVRLVGAHRPQIWMTPVFPQRAAANQDPGTPAFRLPFQNLTSDNHIAQWTEQVVVLE
jgi:hypothetical protein